jgi:hypothetical protein
MLRRWLFSRLALLLTGGLVGVLAQGADAPLPAAPAQAPENVQQLDEVVILGKKLYQLRQDVVKAEDRFYAAYNELNTDNDYDIKCEQTTTAGTRLKSRQCKPVFFAEAEAAEARSMLTGEYAPPAQLVALERADEYRKKALEVINRSPELRKLVRERDALERGYLKARQERFKGRWILFE